MKLLVVEDDAIIRDSLCEILGHWGYVCDAAQDGALALELAAAWPYDLILLDLNLPKIDGLEVCQRLRQHKHHQPLILMLTARDTSHDSVVGLQHGADDYLVKPFDANVLHARIQALLRRASRPLHNQHTWGGLQLDTDGRTACFQSHDLKLTSKEHLLLEALITAKGHTCSKEQLLNAAWSWAESPGEESVKTHIKNIRAKLSTAGAPADLIETVYGVGFRLNANHAV